MKDNFIHTVPDCERIAQKYGLERCLVACKDFCDALDSDREEIFSRDDECLREIIRLAVAKFGARNLYAAFLHISGNVEALLPASPSASVYCRAADCLHVEASKLVSDK